jgi:hypothetical protein
VSDHLDEIVYKVNHRGEFYVEDEHGNIVSSVEKTEKDGKVSYIVHLTDKKRTYTPAELAWVITSWKICSYW